MFLLIEGTCALADLTLWSKPGMVSSQVHVSVQMRSLCVFRTQTPGEDSDEWNRAYQVFIDVILST